MRQSGKHSRSRRHADLRQGAERVQIMITPAERRRTQIRAACAIAQSRLDDLRRLMGILPEVPVMSLQDSIARHRMLADADLPVPARAEPVETPSKGAAAPRAEGATDTLRAAFLRAAEPAAQPPETASRPSDLAAVAMNTTLLLAAPPVGAAMMTHAALRRPDLLASCRAMAIAGPALVVAQQLPVLWMLVGGA